MLKVVYLKFLSFSNWQMWVNCKSYTSRKKWNFVLFIPCLYFQRTVLKQKKNYWFIPSALMSVTERILTFYSSLLRKKHCFFPLQNILEKQFLWNISFILFSRMVEKENIIQNTHSSFSLQVKTLSWMQH